MAHTMVIVLVIILGLLVIGMAVATIVFRQQLTSCEINENPYCPQFTCNDGTPATRKGPNGSTQYSTLTGQPIAPLTGGPCTTASQCKSQPPVYGR